MERAGTGEERGRGLGERSAGLRDVQALPGSRPHYAGSPGCTPSPTPDVGDPGSSWGWGWDRCTQSVRRERAAGYGAGVLPIWG